MTPHLYKITYFLLSRHPELVTKQEFRTFLRSEIEKIESGCLEPRKILDLYEQMSKEEQEKAVEKLEKIYEMWHINNFEVNNKDEIINEAKKYLNKELTINDIRKIYETNLINSPRYKSLSLKNKEEEHHKLLHSFTTAHTSYNKINIVVDFD